MEDITGFATKVKGIGSLFHSFTVSFFFLFSSVSHLFSPLFIRKAPKVFLEGLTEDTSQIVLTFCFFMVLSKTKPDTSSLKFNPRNVCSSSELKHMIVFGEFVFFLQKFCAHFLCLYLCVFPIFRYFLQVFLMIKVINALSSIRSSNVLSDQHPIFFLPTVRQSEKIDNLGDRKYILHTAKGPLVGQMVKLFCLLFAFRLSKPEYLVKPYWACLSNWAFRCIKMT